MLEIHNIKFCFFFLSIFRFFLYFVLLFHNMKFSVDVFMFFAITISNCYGVTKTSTTSSNSVNVTLSIFCFSFYLFCLWFQYRWVMLNTYFWQTYNIPSVIRAHWTDKRRIIFNPCFKNRMISGCHVSVRNNANDKKKKTWKNMITSTQWALFVSACSQIRGYLLKNIISCSHLLDNPCKLKLGYLHSTTGNNSTK